MNAIVNPMFGVQAADPTTLESTGAPHPTCNLSQILSAQHQMNAAALFSSNPPQYLINAQQLQAAAVANAEQNSPARRRRPLNLMSFEGIELVHHNSNRELHQAEKIVETAEQLQKSAFRFDTITPKRSTSPNVAALPVNVGGTTEGGGEKRSPSGEEGKKGN